MKKLMLAVLALASIGSAAAPKWEYAILAYLEGYVEWQSPNGYVTTDSLDKTMQKMGCKLNAGKSANFIDFLNCAGNTGWELVTITFEGKEAEASRYVFKRPK